MRVERPRTCSTRSLRSWHLTPTRRPSAPSRPATASTRTRSRILRRSVSAGARSEAREVLWEAANKLALSAKFDSLLHALSPQLLREEVLTGEEVERILHERLERDQWLMAKTGREHDAGSRREPMGRPSGHSVRTVQPLPPRVRHLNADFWTPTASVSRHLHDDGTVTVYSQGRLVASNVSDAESKRLAREILGGESNFSDRRTPPDALRGGVKAEARPLSGDRASRHLGTVSSRGCDHCRPSSRSSRRSRSASHRWRDRRRACRNRSRLC